jgi:hypothetical protein
LATFLLIIHIILIGPGGARHTDVPTAAVSELMLVYIRAPGWGLGRTAPGAGQHLGVHFRFETVFTFLRAHLIGG